MYGSIERIGILIFKERFCRENLIASKNIARIFNTITNAIRRIAPLIVVIIIMNMMFALTFFVGLRYYLCQCFFMQKKLEMNFYIY